MPFPPRSGADAYSAGLLEALARSGVALRVLCLQSPGGTQAAGGSEPLIELRPVASERRPALASLASTMPRAAHSFATGALAAELDRALGEGPYGAAVVDHLHSAWALPALTNARRSGTVGPICLVAHNHEASARALAAHSARWTSPLRAALELDAWKWRRFESAALASVDLVSAITEEDRRRFAAQAPGLEVLLLPPGYGGERGGDGGPADTTPRRAVVLSSLEWQAKRANLEELLDAADPHYAAAGAEIVVVGSAPAAFRNRIEARLAATRFLGHVEDLRATLAGCRLALVSEPRGGGFKMKTLDLVFAGVPMAVLETSVSGLPLVSGESCLSFPDVDSLVSGSLAALDDVALLRRLSRSAYEACEASFDWDERAQALVAAVAAARNGPGNTAQR